MMGCQERMTFTTARGKRREIIEILSGRQLEVGPGFSGPIVELSLTFGHASGKCALKHRHSLRHLSFKSVLVVEQAEEFRPFVPGIRKPSKPGKRRGTKIARIYLIRGYFPEKFYHAF